jgi:hypothetical protein
MHSQNSNVGKDMCSSHYREDAAVCSSHDREDVVSSRESVDGEGLIWSVATYVQTFHRLHLLRLLKAISISKLLFNTLSHRITRYWGTILYYTLVRAPNY